MTIHNVHKVTNKSSSYFQEKISFDIEESARVQSWSLHMFCSQCFRQFYHWLFRWHWKWKVPGKVGFMSCFSRFLLESRPLSILSKHWWNAMFVSIFNIEIHYFLVHWFILDVRMVLRDVDVNWKVDQNTFDQAGPDFFNLWNTI